MTTPHLRNPCTRGHQIYNFGRPFLCHYFYILGLSDLCLGVEKKIFKEIQQFYTFYPKITSLLGWGSWNLQFLVSLPYRCYIPSLVKIGPIVLEKKMLTHDARRRTPTHSNRSPEWPKNILFLLYLNTAYTLPLIKFFCYPSIPHSYLPNTVLPVIFFQNIG